jgi:transposase
LRETICRKRPQLWTNQSWVLHHDNAPVHSSFLVLNFLAKNETTVIPQPSYSPDLAPADFFLFPKLKSTLKGHRFDTTDEIQKNSTMSCSPFRKKRSKVGRNVGSGALLGKETSLKATNLISCIYQHKAFITTTVRSFIDHTSYFTIYCRQELNFNSI